MNFISKAQEQLTKSLNKLRFVAVICALSTIALHFTIKKHRSESTRGIGLNLTAPIVEMTDRNGVSLSMLPGSVIKYFPTINSQVKLNQLSVFVEQYIALKYGNRPFNYERVVDNGRLDHVRMKISLEKLFSMTVDGSKEMESLQLMYKESPKKYIEMVDECRCSFFIFQKGVDNIVELGKGKIMVSMIVNEIAISEDVEINKEKSQSKNRFLKNKRIWLWIEPRPVLFSTKKEKLNEVGYYVYNSYVQTLDDIEYENALKILKTKRIITGDLK